jgi:hypothetical protein
MGGVASVLAGALLAVLAIFFYSDGAEYTMDYYIEAHEWDKKMPDGVRLLTLKPALSANEAIRTAEMWRLWGIRASDFCSVERIESGDDWRCACYCLRFKTGGQRLYFWTPKYYDDEKFGKVIKSKYVN